MKDSDLRMGLIKLLQITETSLALYRMGSMTELHPVLESTMIQLGAGPQRQELESICG
jgi:hypothetical protein